MGVSSHNISSVDIDKRYMSVIRLLDEIGPWHERLERSYRIVKDPDFTYRKTPTSLFLLATLANSSYWLDKELFDTDVVKKNRTDASLNGMQKCHLYLLDIGSTLMDKGFPLNQKTIDRFVSKDSPLYSWAKNFLVQCHDRNAWIRNEKVVSHKKQPHLSCNQKIR